MPALNVFFLIFIYLFALLLSSLLSVLFNKQSVPNILLGSAKQLMSLFFLFIYIYFFKTAMKLGHCTTSLEGLYHTHRDRQTDTLALRKDLALLVSWRTGDSHGQRWAVYLSFL